MTIHGLLKSPSPAKPMFWKLDDENVARNSSERPGPKLRFEYARAPSTVSAPPATVAAPPPFQMPLVQSLGNVVPENSACSAGLRISSPSPASAMLVFASSVPWPKSASVRSTKHGVPAS